MNDTEIDIAKEFGAQQVLGQRFAIYIPNKDKDGKRVQQDSWVSEALRLLSDVGGGATAMPPVRGAWLNEDSQELIIEEPVLVYSYIKPESFVERLKDLVEFVHRLGKETNQGQMAIEFDNAFFLVDIKE